MPSESQRFTKAQRLRRKGEFQQVFDKGVRINSRYFTLLFTAAPGQAPRLGVVASRKLGDAVRRNRAKRLIREVFRRNRPETGESGLDLIVIPRRELFNARFEDLDDDFRAACRRASARLIARAGR